MLRRTQTVYVETDPFFSPRGKVLHHFDEFLEELARAQMPCVWMTGWTRAQLDEPRRRLGQSDPYIGENGCGVYLPEDYFHLKGSNTIRLGRYTCIPVAKPQPAAAEALEELSSEMGISVVPLRKLSHRELSQNTGLPAKDADLIRLRDFDELFFFAGASDKDVARFRAEAITRGLVVRSAGQFWSLSSGGNLGKSVRELGALYDRALRSHAQRIGVRVGVFEQRAKQTEDRERDPWPSAAFDRTLSLTDRIEDWGEIDGHSESPAVSAEWSDGNDVSRPDPRDARGRQNQFQLGSADVWSDVMASIISYSAPRR
jgi:predicted mannosyl-3-phosphoglycerate phosphatase (HAD superfamily)